MLPVIRLPQVSTLAVTFRLNNQSQNVEEPGSSIIGFGETEPQS